MSTRRARSRYDDPRRSLGPRAGRRFLLELGLMGKGAAELAGQDSFGPVLALIEKIAEHRTLTDLLAELTRGLNQAVGTDAVSIYIHDATTDRLKLHHIDGPLAVDARARQGIEALPLDASPSGHVWRTQEPLVIASCGADTRFPRFREVVRNL